MKTFRAMLAAAVAATCVLSGSGASQAAVIQSATTTLGGLAIDFEGLAEGTIISNQYPGATFSQIDGGTPMIDNSPFLYAYNASSGTGVLTGSMNGGALFPTVAGIVVTLNGAGSALEFWLGDTAPIGAYTIQAFDAASTLLESSTVTPGAFVGFSGLTGLKRVTVDSSSANDAFAIDDVRFTGSNGVPEPMSLGLMGLGLAALGWSRRKRR